MPDMPDIQEALAATAYALFALEQPLSLAEIADGASSGTFPGAVLHTPDWFAAAADSADLAAMAPELRVMESLDTGADDLAGLDLIHVYAPEMAAPPVPQETTPAPGVDEPEPVASPEPREPARLSLLRELSDLDD